VLGLPKSFDVAPEGKTALTASLARPVPVPDPLSAPFWEAAARHVLTVAKCGKCGEVTLPPDLTCPHCHTTEPDFSFVPVEGTGRVRTWTVIRRSFLAGFENPSSSSMSSLTAIPTCGWSQCCSTARTRR
jgi:hypothetical protein